MSRRLSSITGTLLGVVIGCFAVSIGGSPAHATEAQYSTVASNNTSVVIDLIQLGDQQSANNELIQLYNNTSQAWDVTNWCLYYASASTMAYGNKMWCFTPSQPRGHIYLPPKSYATIASKQFVTNVPSLVVDGTFSSTLSGSAGHLRLVDQDGSEKDKVGWGNSVSPEGVSAVVPTNGNVLMRVMMDDEYGDSNNNAVDFLSAQLHDKLRTGELYEVEDVCANLDGVQANVPEDMVVDDVADCTKPIADVCPNLLGTQESIPPGYQQRQDGSCWMHVDQLLITELLPNPLGADTGNEYIELYNDSEEDVALGSYVVKIGQASEDTLRFIHAEVIKSHDYFVVGNDRYSFTLLNSTSVVTLETSDGQMTYQTLPYYEPADGLAWALIDDRWQYTNRPTPAAANLSSFDSVDSDVVNMGVALAPCATNQYRNPATGRCKLIASQGSTLVPCKSNQYRSLETNRCRAIVSSTTTIKSCPLGQVRNAETNRCRKIVSHVPTPQSYGVIKGSGSGDENYVMWIVAGLLVLAASYVAWEWHPEIGRAFVRARSFVLTHK